MDKGKKGLQRITFNCGGGWQLQGSLNLGAEFKGSKRYFVILKKGLISKNDTVPMK